MSSIIYSSRAAWCVLCHKPPSLCTCERDSEGVIDLMRVLDDAPPYTVINLRTEERGTFRTAHDVAMFMWGRDFERYEVRKEGRVFFWTDGDLAAFEQALEAA